MILDIWDQFLLGVASDPRLTLPKMWVWITIRTRGTYPIIYWDHRAGRWAVI